MGTQNDDGGGSRVAGRVAFALLLAQGGLIASGGAEAAIDNVTSVRTRLIQHHFPGAQPEQANPQIRTELAQYWPNWNSWRNCYGYYGWVPQRPPWRWPRC